MDMSHINPATAADVLALQQIALQEGKTLSEYGSQRSESKISPETQFEADALASKVRMQAELVEPQITSDMKGLESDSKKLTGLDYRLKGETSLSRKILSDAQFENIPLQEAASNIGDSVRYTLLCPEATYSTDVVESLEELVSKGYKIRKFKNTFTSDVYRGINVSMESPDGTVFELQFHTDESFNTKENLNHLFYEIARNDFTSPEAKTLANRIMKQNTTSVKIPEGVEKINIMQSFKDQGYNLMEVMPLQIESELDKARAKYPNLTSGQVETLRQVLLNDPSMDMSNLVVS